MKKTLAIILVLVILFAGCQKTEKTPEIEGTKINLSDNESYKYSEAFSHSITLQIFVNKTFRLLNSLKMK